MVVCKFWQADKCRFGDACRFEHPSRQGGQQNQRPPQNQHLKVQNPGFGGRGGKPQSSHTPKEITANDGPRKSYSRKGTSFFLSLESDQFGGVPLIEGIEEDSSFYDEDFLEEILPDAEVHQEEDLNEEVSDVEDLGRQDNRHDNRYDNRQDGRHDHHNQGQQRFDMRNLPYNLDTRAIRHELTNELPIWPLSCYGPGTNAPRMLLHGSIERSPEEARAMFYLAGLQGNVDAAMQHEQDLSIQARSQINAILNDMEGACKYVVDGKDGHPNRLDIVRDSVQGSFGNIAQGPHSVFARDRDRSRPDANEIKPFPHMQAGPTSGGFDNNNAGGLNAFGQLPAQSSPFAQPGPFAQPQQHSQPSAFNQPAASVSASPFGQPSMLGQPVFGQPSMPQQQPSFTQTSLLQQQSPFSQPSMSQLQSSSGQASNAFGQVPQQDPSSFGQATAPVQQTGFAPAQFGQSAMPANPNNFAQTPPTSNPFGQQHDQSQQSVQQPNAFSLPPAPQPNGVQPRGHMWTGAPPVHPAYGPLFRTPGAGRFFPFRPAYDEGTEAPAAEYGEEGSERRRVLEETYRNAVEAGKFEGMVPEIPPLDGWCDKDW
ncbi:hypothetical protein NA57DRAFT_58782 [Rhizodiscina lignyota]|uniref:C3H1-type domain-containing protein n=1 Tax=Rhizodiscina lignyota TaxID=1504668 RepID=A0A9P4IA54_9PEZI|nr:hypothetical protein NA57DRAFT_58782 [Rhizodiscina lignyota]